MVGERTAAGGAALVAATPRLERRLSPAAERALVEAEERRRMARAAAGAAGDAGVSGAGAEVAGDGAGGAREIGGRKGPEPTRYGDWEVKGIATDF